MTQYQFWGGLNTIGGNIVEVETERARVICDFGLTVGGQSFGNKQDISMTEQLIMEGKLPAFPGLYDTRGFKKTSLASYEEEKRETAILVSHLHLDHMGALRYLPVGTMVYLSEEAYQLYQALVRVEEEVESDLDFQTFKPGESFMVGDITVTPKASDHDTVGASAFFIETSDLKLIHSGDVRLSGDYPERISQWIEDAKKWKPDVLLLEGTSFSFEESLEVQGKSPETESELAAAWTTLLETEKEQIIFFNPYIRNIDRLKKLMERTEQSGRIMVLEREYAEVLHDFYPNEKWSIFQDGKSVEEAPYLEQVVDLKELALNPSKYVLQNSFKNLDRLEAFDKGIYCHSNGEPLGAYDDNYQVLLDKLEANHFTFLKMGTSGHAGKAELIQIAKEVGASETIPWHSLQPEKFQEALQANGIQSLLPRKNHYYVKNTVSQ